MSNKTGHKKTALDVIKHQLRIFNWTVPLIVFALLFLVVRSRYLILDYIPFHSVVAITSIVAGLVVIGLYLANNASKNALKKTEEYSDKLNSILTITRDTRDIVYGDVLLDKILDSSLKITGADAGSILLAEGDRLVFKIVRGIEDKKLSGFSISKSHGIAGWVVENSSAIRIDDVKNDSRFYPEIDNITGYKTKSVLCVPLQLSSGVIGALELLNKKNGGFSYEDEELISYFADQAAISLSRAQFYEDQKNYEIHLTDILLDAIESHTPGKRRHSKRVAKYSLLIVDAINMSEDEKKILYRASLFHDIGFIRIKPKDVSSKGEYEKHSRIGYEMLLPITFYADITSIILHHHERYDGNGYPLGLKGEEIPLGSRIIFIAEAFDAMVSKDSYKYSGKMIGEDARPSIYNLNTAIEELKKNAGTQFDPKLVEIFVENIDESSLEGI